MMKTENRRQKTEDRMRNAERSTTRAESRGTSRGFSLTEVLLAVGTLAVGMLFIAGVFPVSIHFTTVATERTIAAAAADEAFAKIKLYGVNLTDPDLSYSAQALYEDVTPVVVPGSEFAYPSNQIPITKADYKRYWWSALCSRVSDSEVRVTVFVSRKAGMSTNYYMRNPNPPNNIITAVRPMPVILSVSAIAGGGVDELRINDSMPADTINEIAFVSDGYTIVDDSAGYIYRVLERYKSPDNIIRLDRAWYGAGAVWVIPPPVGGGRYPCIAVYQKVMRF